MKKKKGISLILISITIFIVFKLNTYNDYYEHNKIIDDIFVNGSPNYTDYIGYIKIDNIKLKRGIKLGINDKILDEYNVGMIKSNNIILAGHAVENVFGNLYKLRIEDEISLYLDKIIKYKIADISVVNKNDFNHLNSDLVLITCMIDSNKRLIINAKKIES